MTFRPLIVIFEDMGANFKYLLNDGHELQLSAYGMENINKKKCIIYIHGFKGFKDWGFVPYLGEFLSSHGFLLITFNFSHNGIGEKPLEFTELTKFFVPVSTTGIMFSMLINPDFLEIRA